MITKTEWQSVHHQRMGDERRGMEPPTAEEMFAYTRGELSAEQETHVRERLVCYPELVRTLTAEFPTEGAERGDPDFMPDDEFAKHWASLQKRMRPHASEGGRVVQLWRFTAAIAAAIAVALGTMLWQVSHKPAEPRVVWEEQVLLPDGHRGPADAGPVLSPQGESVLLVVSLIGQRNFQQYRLGLIDGASDRVLWNSGVLASRDAESIAILVPRSFLKPGRYQIAVYGITGPTAEPVGTYSLRVAAGQS